MKGELNVNWKAITNYIIAFVTGCLISVIVTLVICNGRINRADSAITALRTDLSESRAELERSRVTIDSIRELNTELTTKQSELTSRLSEGNAGLRGVIESLQIIRDKVQDIESQLNSYYSCIGSSDCDYNNKN